MWKLMVLSILNVYIDIAYQYLVKDLTSAIGYPYDCS